MFLLYCLLSFCYLHVRSQGINILQVQGYDCSNIWERDHGSTSGIYTIKPVGSSTPFMVYCEMRVDGGWTVIQKHNGQDQLSFDQTWIAYKTGFGNIASEHWLGLDNIYWLTNQNGRSSELLINLKDFGEIESFALYNSFKVGPENCFYKLLVDGYSGNAGDAFRGRDNDTNEIGSYFSTTDIDHDKCNPCGIGDMRYNSCARTRFHSGWWFNRCGIANLNGQWHDKGSETGWSSAVHWQTWRNNESLKQSIMYVRNY
ncbi:angiopoietin-related protein 5-like [Bombina bombina]|uniref:angiopoietin-related protein 5-like n=1 Tax=Bombina bombina TaxID=8345 RepID=UPI00235A9DF4|nr:angiopoietin-related protein 5-like [Bombina bombina]